MTKSEKTTVLVAWNQKAVDLANSEGWDELKKCAEENEGEYAYDEITFNTKEEANAYIRGINDGNGWDDPYAEIKE